MSNTQVNKILTTASSVMKRQVGRTIAANPFETLDRLPNERRNDDEEENTIVAESQVYAPSEVLTLINAADELYARTILHLLYMTGLRHGEALGLQWPDFSFDNKELFVDRQLKKIKNGEPIFGPPKNNSKPHVPLPKKLIADLRKWKLACPPPSKWNLVFPSEIGGPQHRKSTWNIMDKTTTTASLKEPTRPLKRLRVHDLRHTFASIRLRNHTDIVELSGMLDHSSTEVTSRAYVHFDPRQRDRKSTDSFSNAIYGASSLDLHFSKSKASTNDT